MNTWKKYSALMLAFGMVVVNTIPVNAAETNLETEVVAESNVKNLAAEIDFSKLVDAEEPVSNEVFALVDDAEIHSEELDDGSVLLSFTNTGVENIDKWTIAYEADYKVLNASNAIVSSAEDVIELAADSTNETIFSGETEEIELAIEGDFEEPEVYRVYALATAQSDVEVADSITYDSVSESVQFDIFDADTAASNVVKDRAVIGDDIKSLIGDVDTSRADLNTVIGKDERTKVTAVNSNPYNRIAIVFTTWSNGVVSQGTAFMISQEYMLTAGHNVYNSSRGGAAKSIVVYFGANGNTYSKKVTAASWSWCASFSTNGSIENDWGAIKLSSKPARGYFSIGSTTDSTLKKSELTVCGYPGDKAVTSSKAIVNGQSRYMYKMSKKPSKVQTNTIYYTIDTYGGQSGSPVYNSSYVVYGIHTKGGTDLNGCRRLTSTLVKSFIDKGWCK